MCFGNKSAKKAQKEAAAQQKDIEQRERRRQSDVLSGKGAIDSAFGQFDPDYYNRFKSAYQANYFPELEKQFTEASGKLVAALAGKGQLESTAGFGRIAGLKSAYDDKKREIGNESENATSGLRGNVERTKTNLYSLNEASADPQGIGARAVGEASALVAPPAYSPLGQVFAAALQPMVNYTQARQNRPGPAYRSPYAFGAGSGRVVS